MKKIILAFLVLFSVALTNSASAQSAMSRDSADQHLNAMNSGGDNILLFPNPAQAELNVVFDSKQDIRNIAVYNLIGKAVSVYKITGNSAKLDVDNIPSGIYFLRFIDGQGRVTATRKFTHQ